jgi:hypothetical protein
MWRASLFTSKGGCGGERRLPFGMTGVFAHHVLLLSGLKTGTVSRASLIVAPNPVGRR